MVKPMLKWAGGKSSLIPHIISLLPSDYRARAYHEPFFGGGAVFFKIKPLKGSINDINSRLVNFYRIVRDDPEGLIRWAQQFPYDRETFYQLREKYNKENLSQVEDAALTLYLNRTGFNGLYRVNSSGDFNVPFGKYKNPLIVDEKRIRIASSLFQNIDICEGDFTYILEKAEEGSITYFDPPYVPLNDTSNFTSYARNGFNWSDQLRLRDTCIELDRRGAFFILSNSYVKDLIKLYLENKNLRIYVAKVNRAINSNGSLRGPVKEILITNIPKVRF
jgi:DNA adenine methylase